MKKNKLKIISIAILVSFVALIAPPVYAYSQNTELLTNGGFESTDISMWNASTCTFARDSSSIKSGSYSMLTTNRINIWSGPTYNVTEILYSCGQGTYNFSAWMKLLTGASPAPMYVILYVNSSGAGQKWNVGSQVTVTSAGFSQSTASNVNITWTGDLTNASLYVQNATAGVTTSLYIDDFSLIKTSAIIETPAYISTAQTLALRDVGPPQIGAIRWDAYLPIPDPVGLQVARAMGPSEYHFRLPYFSLVYGDDNVDFPPYTQTILDAEINYADYAGIDYFAYDWYPIGNSMATARDLHVSSSLRDKVKMSAILFVNPFGAAERAQLVGYFKQSFYMKVQNGRPLVYFFEATNALQTIIYIQQDCLAQGIPMPYFVSMDWSVGLTTGFDAVSHYALGGSDGATYNTLAQTTENNWNTQKATGAQVVPLINTGWDTRPIYDHPCTWYTTPANNWVQTATTSEIVTHTQNCINWINNNSSATLANAAIMYAWNEHMEGGWLCPTVQVDASGNALKDTQGKNLVNTDRVDALHNLLNPEYILGDVNNNGSITSSDALMALQISSGRLTPTEFTSLAADVDKSGTVTAADALKILQFASGRITRF